MRLRLRNWVSWSEEDVTFHLELYVWCVHELQLLFLPQLVIIEIYRVGWCLIGTSDNNRIKPTHLTTPLSTQMISLLFLISVSENYQIQWGILIVCCQQNVIQVVPWKKRKEYSHHGKIPSSNFRFSILSQYVFLHLQIIWIVYLVAVKGADNSIISKTVFWYQDS